MKKNKGVNIIIPVYQVEKYIYECLESVIHQTYPNIHVIIIDDGSLDNSGKIADKYASEHDNITVIHQKNGGLSAARNCGLLLSDQEYVYFLDSDDYIELTAIEKLVNTIEKTKADFVFMEREGFIDGISDGKKDIHLNHCTYQYETRCGKEQFCQLIKNDEYRSCVPYIFFKREYLLKNNLCFKEGILHEDELFTFLAFEANGLVAHCFESLYHLRRRPDSIMTSRTTLRNFDSILIIYYELLEKYLKKSIDGESALLGLQRIANITYGKYRQLSEDEKKERKQEVYRFRRSVLKNNGFGDNKLKKRCVGRLYKVWVRGNMKLKHLFNELRSLGVIKFESWNVAIREINGKKLYEGNDAPFTVIDNPRGYWMADPFLFEYRNHRFLFAEMYDIKKKHGCLGVAEIQDGKCGKMIPFMKLEYHLSYPCVFMFRGEIFMTPECCSSGEIPLYKAVEFPCKWEKVDILAKVLGSDTTPVILDESNNDIFYLTTVYNEGVGNRFNNNIWRVDPLKNELLPIIVDDTRVRGAGHLIKTSLGYLRPSQDDTEMYGKQLLFNLVSCFNPYKENSILCIKPPNSDVFDNEMAIRINFNTKDSKKQFVGIHTYNVDTKYEVVDLKCMEMFSIKTMIRKISKRLKKKLFKCKR